MKIVLLTAVGVGGATVIGSIIGFIFKNLTEKYADKVLSFAAGVMLATSVFNLIIPSVENENSYSEIISVAGIFSGSLCITILDMFVKKIMCPYYLKFSENTENEKTVHGIILFISAIAIHNLPEGIAAGVGFGTGNTADALIIAGSIALQNLPEGMVVVSPMLSVGISRSKTFLIAVFTGIIEVIGTLFGYCAVNISNSILPFALSFAGGTMIYVICGDMIPETQSVSGKQNTIYSLICGFCLMIILNSII